MRAGLLAALLAATFAPSAQAATVTLEYEPPIPEIEPDPAYTLAVEAAQGETNRLRVMRDDRGFVVRETGSAPLTAADRCASAAPGEVVCPLSGGASHLSVFVDAGDSADVVVAGPLGGVELAEVVGGAGDDALQGHEGEDLLKGASGEDVLAGEGGNDRIDGGPDSDLLNGGEGRDLVSYASHVRAVRVDLAEGRGGSKGERDQITGFEDLAGGEASDLLFGDGSSNLIFGGLGGKTDVGRGRGGDDVVTVRRRAVGGAGDDVVDAEHVECGAGHDVAFRQRFRPDGPYGAACERIRGFFYIVTRPSIDHRKMVLRYTCPIRACRGTVALYDRDGRLGVSSYAADGQDFGGPRSVRVRVKLERKPEGRIGEFVITGRSLARDSFRIVLR